MVVCNGAIDYGPYVVVLFNTLKKFTYTLLAPWQTLTSEMHYAFHKNEGQWKPIYSMIFIRMYNSSRGLKLTF